MHRSPAFRPRGPQGPVHAYQTYAVKQRSDALVLTACADAGCENWRDGWDTICDERVADGYVTDTGQAVGGATAAAYIRHESGRTFRELTTGEGFTVFRFEPGQRCFGEHHTAPRRFLVVGGDYRAYTGVERQHANGADWLEDAIETCDRVFTRVARG